MKRFVVVTDAGDSITADDRNAITTYLVADGWDYWHWFEDLWLIQRRADAYDVNYLRDRLIAVSRAKHILIICVDENAFYTAGTVPDGSEEWLRTRWLTLTR